MCRILVADDERDVVSLLKDYLELKGYEVITAYDGRQAVEAACIVAVKYQVFRKPCHQLY